MMSGIVDRMVGSPPPPYRASTALADDAVRVVTRTVLRNAGYLVLDVANGEVAERRHKDPFGGAVAMVWSLFVALLWLRVRQSSKKPALRVCA